MFGVLRRAWLPLLIVVVLAVGVGVVHRVRSYFGGDDSSSSAAPFEDTKPFHPKIVVYEIFSPDGTYADINYLDLDATPQRLDGASLPWSLTLSTTNPAVSPNIVAQGDGATIGCRVTIDGEVKDERIATGPVSAQTFCIVKSA
ncbi:MmpS family transport accessory protein [[Mycobacterium] kokjensenii]|uniref:MmpS family transport accessory protein n=1 Tax=[Mycobacterium] kokjensenii TaxID=3064287 RepID=A0ABN9NC14_9MYCO|nr:MmpS family transport accessory protein [Mycolicibacter sp. MU0083]CAJ1502491.1 MmpS family transport accessory protein [Mycolicibacter sp. MU0083]